jgi:uroporphyrinogen III methyltransferase/synthase
MGAGTIGEIARRLVEGGLAPSTPVAAVRSGTRADQVTVRGTLADIAEADVRAPSAIVVGDVAALDLSWFETRPLFGRSVVVTRAREQASELRARLEPLGAEVLELPAITVEAIDVTLPTLDDYSWLVFTSENGVREFFARGLEPAGLDARALAGLRVAVVGPGTEHALAARGIRADLVPQRAIAESLVDAFPEPAAHGDGVLVARAERGRDVLPDGLTARGYTVDVLPVYRTEPAPVDPELLARVAGGGVDAITFTSSSTVDNLCDALGALPDPQPLVVSIGPVTSDAARRRGLRVDTEAEPHTIDGLVGALLHALSRDPHSSK